MTRPKSRKTGRRPGRGLTARASAQLIAQAAYDVKGEEIRVLDLRALGGFTDYFVIASGRSDRQVQAIADRISEHLAKLERKPIGLEGYQKGHWILMDYGDVVAHIFYTEARTFYALEKLWGDARSVKVRLT